MNHVQIRPSPKMVLHYVDSDFRERAKFALLASDIGLESVFYDGILDVVSNPPDGGIFFVGECPHFNEASAILASLRSSGVDLPLVVLGEGPRTNTALESLQAGAFDYAIFPLSSSQIAKCIDRISGHTSAMFKVSSDPTRHVESRADCSMHNGRTISFTFERKPGGSRTIQDMRSSGGDRPRSVNRLDTLSGGLVTGRSTIRMPRRDYPLAPPS